MFQTAALRVQRFRTTFFVCLAAITVCAVLGTATILVLLTPPSAPGALRAAEGLVSSARSPSVLVMITVWDATTGDQTELVCRTAGDRTGSDVLLMDAETARDVLPALC